MKQNSRKNEIDRNDAASLENNKGNAQHPTNQSSRPPDNFDNKTDNAAAADKSDNVSEIARNPEGRPGSFGIDDF